MTLGATEVTILSDDFDNNTISGTGVGNTMSFDDGWDVDLTGTASDLTSIANEGNGFKDVAGTFSSFDNAFVDNILSTAGENAGFSFTFTPSTGFNLTSLDITSGHASAGGNLKDASADLTVTISSGVPVYMHTENFGGGTGWFTTSFDLSAIALTSGSEHTLTVDVDNNSGGGAPVFDLVTLKGMVLIPPQGTLISIR